MIVIAFVSCIFDQYPHTAVTMTFSSTCSKCGIIKKSGKLSCCGRGGSWFGNCGSAGNTKLDHTWYEGLQACKAQRQSETVISQQLNEAQQQVNHSSSGDGITAAKPFVFTPAPMQDAPTLAPANTSKTHATLTMNSKPSTTAVTATIFTLTNTSALILSLTAVDTPSTISERISITHNSGNTSIKTPVYTTVTSQGCRQLLVTITYISLLLTVAFFESQSIN